MIRTELSILIIANGDLPQHDIIQRSLQKANLIIAVDGGSNFCYRENIIPQYIVGDLDSIEDRVLEYFKNSTIVRMPDQNQHDLDKALQFALTLEPKEIYVIGGWGKRVDHTLANLLLLQSQTYPCPLSFIDDYGELFLISSDYRPHDLKSRTVSLFSFLPVEGLSLNGFKYPISNLDFPEGFSGLSNVVLIDNPQITITSGSLFIYILNENITA